MEFLGRAPQAEMTERLWRSTKNYDAVALAGMKFSGSSNRSLFRSSCRIRKRLTHFGGRRADRVRHSVRPAACDINVVVPTPSI
jgi:hypothetical protein